MDEIKKIELNSKANSVIKTGITVKAVLLLLSAIGSFYMAYEAFGSPIWMYIMLVIGVVLASAFVKMLSSVFFRESIILTKDTITIAQEFPFRTKTFQFAVNDILCMGFAEQHYTRNAMDNPVVDFTGLVAGEKELQYVIDEGNILLQTEEKAMKFGKNMPSWDVEELMLQVETFTGRKFVAPVQEPEEEAGGMQEGLPT